MTLYFPNKIWRCIASGRYYIILLAARQIVHANIAELYKVLRHGFFEKGQTGFIQKPYVQMHFVSSTERIIE